ncbi:hypothetical protein EZV62_006403 [Acer yangbiense]|uniref:Uncharacterized protein n=1 Tax=Acer yangbiense TaxID=1000413 RepID=A0A5C7I7T8_9ROSI|nr:hypothetical protein EZV62_006403 [Acer yangbiense]
MKDQLFSMTTDDIVRAFRLLDNEIRVLKVCSAFSSEFDILATLCYFGRDDPVMGYCHSHLASFDCFT